MSCPTGTPPATVGLLTALLRGTGCSAAQQQTPLAASPPAPNPCSLRTHPRFCKGASPARTPPEALPRTCSPCSPLTQVEDSEHSGTPPPADRAVLGLGGRARALCQHCPPCAACTTPSRGSQTEASSSSQHYPEIPVRSNVSKKREDESYRAGKVGAAGGQQERAARCVHLMRHATSAWLY